MTDEMNAPDYLDIDWLRMRIEELEHRLTLLIDYVYNYCEEPEGNCRTCGAYYHAKYACIECDTDNSIRAAQEKGDE